MSQYHINQKAWFVGRQDFKNHKLEYLDHERDVFYYEGVMGYASKAEAHERADRYKGDKTLIFLIGPNYGRYRLCDARQVNPKYLNTQLARFKIMDNYAKQNPDKPELVDELRQMLRDFAFANGIWRFSGIPKTREFIDLVGEYQALSESEMVRMIYGD